MVVVCFNLISCKKDEPINTNDNIVNTLKKYKWYYNGEYELGTWGDDDASLSIEATTLFFLDNGKGVMKSRMVEDDTYFGHSASTDAYGFTYNVNGNIITIRYDDYPSKPSTYAFANNVLTYKSSSGSDDYDCLRMDITSEDREWLKKTQYYVLSDDERCNIKYGHGWKYISTLEGQTHITAYLSIPASEMVASRKLSSITATYSIPGTKKNEKNTLLIYDDKSYTNTINLFIKRSLPVTIFVIFSAYDSKNNEEVAIGYSEYTITTNGSADYN